MQTGNNQEKLCLFQAEILGLIINTNVYFHLQIDPKLGDGIRLCGGDKHDAGRGASLPWSSCYLF